MILLADNDLILKLAQCDLLKDLHILLGLESPAEIFVLPTARFQLIPKSEEKALKKAGNAKVLDAIRDFLRTASELTETANEAILRSLEAVQGIDHGEQLLLASMVEFDGAIMATSDKRALKAVADNRDCLPEIFAALVSRVLVFESALLLALIVYGFPNIKQRLLSNPKPDGTLRLVLNSEMGERDFVSCLVSYSRELFPFFIRREVIGHFFES